MQGLTIRSKHFLCVAFVGIIMITVAQFKETEISFLTVHIVSNTFESSKEKGLAHHIEIARKWIDEMHKMLRCISLQVLIISFARERVIENFVESFTHKLLADQILQLLTNVVRSFDSERRLKTRRNLDVVVTINAENILNNIARTLHINAISRNLQRKSL